MRLVPHTAAAHPSLACTQAGYADVRRGAAETAARTLTLRPLSLDTNPAGAPPPLLLQVGDDAHLAQSRVALLKMAGLLVRSCSSQQFTVVAQQVSWSVRAALFCHSIAPEQARAFAHALLEHNADVCLVRLSLHASQEPDGIQYDVLLQTPVSPVTLVSTLLQLQNTRLQCKRPR
jgi:hypothetical protein